MDRKTLLCLTMILAVATGCARACDPDEPVGDGADDMFAGDASMAGDMFAGGDMADDVDASIDDDMGPGGDMSARPIERLCADGEDEDGDDLPDCADPDCASDPACADLPPNPSSLMRAWPARSSSGVADLLEVFTTSSPPIQRDFVPGRLSPAEVAVTRGKVLDTLGRPLPGVKVEVVGDPALGHTRSRADGAFDLLVEGASAPLLRFSAPGYPSISRRLYPASGSSSWLDAPVVMTPYSDVATTITLGTTGSTAIGERVEDADGARQARLYFPPDLTAEFELPDGTRQPAPDELTVRVTEYTRGAQGLQAMPGPLPEMTAYTWAAEYSVDEAVEAGAVHVHFSRPVSTYLDNFLALPVGAIIPSGFYETDAGVWEPQEDGVVIEVLAIEDGVASLDLDGDGAPDPEDQLARFSITPEERAAMATLFQPGDQVWRARFEHFSPFDLNLGLSFDQLRGERFRDWLMREREGMPGIDRPSRYWPFSQRKRRGLFPSDDCNKAGSIIDCQGQRLSERFELAGSTHELVVQPATRSENQETSVLVWDESWADGLSQAVGGITRLQGLRLSLEYAGHRIEHDVLADELPERLEIPVELPYEDAWGRSLEGRVVTCRMNLTFYFSAQFIISSISRGGEPGAGFGRMVPMEQVESLDAPREQNLVPVPLDSQFDVFVGHRSPTLSIAHHHHFDTALNVLERGDGRREFLATSLLEVPSPRAAANCTNCYDPPLVEGPRGLLTGKLVRLPSGRVVGVADANRFIDGDATRPSSYSSRYQRVLFEVDEQGMATILLAQDPSTTDLLTPYLAAHRERDIIYLANYSGRVIELTLDDLSTRVIYDARDEAAKTPSVTRLSGILDLDVMPGGDLLLLENARIQDAEGQQVNGPILRTISTRGDNLITESILTDTATRAWGGDFSPTSISVSPNGRLYAYGSILDFADESTEEVIIEIHQGNRFEPIIGLGERELEDEPLPIDEVKLEGVAPDFLVDGEESIYFSLKEKSGLRYLTGQVVKVEHGLAKPRYLGGASDAKKCHDLSFADARACRGPTNGFGFLFVGEDADALLVQESTSGPLIRVTSRWNMRSGGERFILPSRRNPELYEFDWAGRHHKTFDARTGALLHAFEYDDQGRLIAMSEGVEQVQTTINWRDDAMVEVTSASGKTTRLDHADGLGITYPSGETRHVAFEGGVISAITSGDGAIKRYVYDDDMRLIEAIDDAEGATQTLTRVEEEGGVTVTHTDALGRSTRYISRFDASQGTRTSETITPAGASTNVSTGYEEQVGTYPDGTRFTRSLQRTTSLERWDPDGYGLGEVEVTYPDGRAITRRMRARSTFDPTLPGAGLARHVAEDTFNAANTERTWTQTYDATTGQFLLETPEGRRRFLRYQDGVVVEAVRDLDMTSAPTTVTYDEQGRVARVSEGARFWEYTWDGDLVVARTNANGEQYQYDYDENGRLEATTWPSGRTWRYEHDSNGNLSSLSTPSAATYTFTHDRAGHTLSSSAPGQSALERAFAAGIELAATTLPTGQTIARTYDQAGRIDTIEGPLSRITFGYNGALDRLDVARWEDLASGAFHQTSRTYNGPHLTREALDFSGTSHTVDYTYNAFGEVTGVDVSGAPAVTLERDRDGELSRIGDWQIQRNAAGAAFTRLTAGSVRHEVEYDMGGALIRRDIFAGNTLLLGNRFDYDLAGRLITRKRNIQGEPEIEESYVYDVDGQLVEVWRDGILAKAYTWDEDRNRASVADGDGAEVITTYRADGAPLTRGGASIAVDGGGRVTGFDGWSLTYSARGALLEAAHTDGRLIRYGWDWMGRMTARDDGTSRVHFIYANIAKPFQLTHAVDHTGAMDSYLYDELGILLEVRRGNTRFMVGADFIGSPEVLWASTGAIAQRIERDRFGEVTSRTPAAFAHVWVGFAGGVEDPDTGLVRFGLRDYHPGMGRWMMPDPIGFSGSPTNLYEYASNNPVSLTDPTGLFCVGGSGYVGVGGGFQGCVDREGFSACGEFGFGAGGGFDLQPLGEPSEDLTEAELSGKVGAFGGSFEFGGKVNSCSEGSGILGLGLGPLGVDLTKPENFKINPLDDTRNHERPSAGSIGLQLEGKAALRQCRGGSW